MYDLFLYKVTKFLNENKSYTYYIIIIDRIKNGI